MNLLHDFYERETGKQAKLIINHGTIYTGEYIQWLEKKIMESDVRILIKNAPAGNSGNRQASKQQTNVASASGK